MHTDPSGVSVPSTTLRTAHNAVALTIAELSGKVFTLLYMVVATRVLAPDEFGQFVYALALGTLFVVIPRWGFSPDLIRRASADRDQLDDLLSASLVVTLGSGVVVFTVVGLVAGATRDTREGAVVLMIMLAAILLDAVADRLRAAAAAIERQRATSVALVANRILTAVLIMGLLLAGWGVVGMGVGFLAGSVLDVVLTTMILRRLDVRPRPVVVPSHVRLVVQGSTVLGISSVAAMLVFRVDQPIIEWLLGTAALATYAVAYKMFETVLFLTWSLSRAILPVLVSAGDPARARRGLAEGVAVLSAVYVPFAAVALMEPAASIDLVFGEQFGEPAADVLRWLAPAPLLFGVSFLGAKILVARDREGFALLGSGTAVVLNVALNVALIPTHGIVAAAGVTSLTLAVRSVIVLWATPIPHAAVVAMGATTNAVIGALAVAGVLAILDVHVLLELLAASLAYVVVWGTVTRYRSPEHIALIRAILPGRAK